MVHLTEIVGGASKERHLCVDHANVAVGGALRGPSEASNLKFVAPERSATVQVTRTQIERGDSVRVKFPDGLEQELRIPHMVVPPAAPSMHRLLTRVFQTDRGEYRIMFEVIEG